MTTAPNVLDVRGAGQVARAFLDRVAATPWRVAELRDSRGFLTVPHAVRAEAGHEPTVLVDCTPPRYDGPAAETWVATLEEALLRGLDVVTCNKAPLATGWSRLAGAAEAGGAALRYAATVGGGTPILDTLAHLHRAHGVVRVEAALSGSLAFIIERIVAGDPLDAAVRSAQENGYTEPDPAIDLDGTDVQAKAVILHNHLFPDERPLALQHVRYPLRWDADEIRRLSRLGRVPQVVATVEPGWVDVRLHAPPAGRASQFGGAVAWVRAKAARGATFHLAGPGAGPAATAGTLLADLGTLTGHLRAVAPIHVRSTDAGLVEEGLPSVS